MNLWPFYILKEDEQVLVIGIKKCKVVNGPGLVFIPPVFKVIKRKAVCLKANEYIKIEEKKQKTVRVVKGPQHLFLNPEEEVKSRYTIHKLARGEFCRVLNAKTGKLKIEKGEKVFALEEHERIVGENESAIWVGLGNAVLVEDEREGLIKWVESSTVFYPGPYEEVIKVVKKDEIKNALDDKLESCVKEDKQSLIKDQWKSKAKKKLSKWMYGAG